VVPIGATGPRTRQVDRVLSFDEGVTVMIQLSNPGGTARGRVGRGSGTRVLSPHPRQALNSVRTLRTSLGRFGRLSDPDWAEAHRVLAEIEVELRDRRPDRRVVAARLERFVDLVVDAGSDPSLLRPTRAIATWVGPVGAKALAGRLP
jgi:hypothetical protein